MMNKVVFFVCLLLTNHQAANKLDSEGGMGLGLDHRHGNTAGGEHTL